MEELFPTTITLLNKYFKVGGGMGKYIGLKFMEYNLLLIDKIE